MHLPLHQMTDLQTVVLTTYCTDWCCCSCQHYIITNIHQ